MLRAQPPTHRPAWMVVLAATMLLYGGMTLVVGLLTLRDPGAAVHQTVRNVARAPAMDEAVRKLEPVLDGILARHRTGLRADAIAKVAFGLFTLYAVAAVLSRDRHGRLLALLTAAFCTAYQLGELPLASRMARETVAAAGPLLGEMMAAGGDAAGRSSAEQLATLESASAVLAAIGVAWSLLLLRYFGGRRGRELYGLRRDLTRS